MSTPDDTVLWTLAKNGTLAKAVIRTPPGTDADVHLRMFVLSDVMHEFRACRPGPRPALESVALQKRLELIQQGWVDAPGTWPKVDTDA
jgi:hypothetical protein